MDDVKDKVKGFMKKVNKPFASSSGKFKGQGRVLGSSSSSSSSSSGHSDSVLTRPQANNELKQNRAYGTSNPSPPHLPQNVGSKQNHSSVPSQPKSKAPSPPKYDHKPEGFNPFDPVISSTKRAKNGISLNVFECPVCGDSYRSEEEVSEHIESCLNNRVENAQIAPEFPNEEPNVELRNELADRVGVFMSGDPSEGSVEVVLKLLKNILRDPGNAKFRRIRMSNPKIKEAIGMVTGGVELLEGIGFQLKEDEEEMWATMEDPSEQQIFLIKEAIALLEPRKADSLPLADSSKSEIPVEQKKVVDRQVRVFFSVPENLAAKIELPDSFYYLSADEVRREAESRKKKLADSQLLIPKSYKEKQIKAARRRYKATVIRVQFPDGVVLQGVFLPWEPTIVLYEFVASALKEPSLEFELLQPAIPKRRVIPRFPGAGERPPTLEDEGLVPSALIKFKPIETDSVVFTGLCNELLEVSEPLTSATGVGLP